MSCSGSMSDSGPSKRKGKTVMCEARLGGKEKRVVERRRTGGEKIEKKFGINGGFAIK